MLEKHHLGQAMDLHYNINGKLLELKGWCEVIQPAPSLSDRSHLPPHTMAAGRRKALCWRMVRWRTFVARLPSLFPPPRLFLTHRLVFFFSQMPHLHTHMEQPDSVCTGGFSFRCDLQWTLRALFICEYEHRRQGDKQRGGGVRGGAGGI